MLCGRESYLARPLPKHPDILRDQLEGGFWQDQVEAAGAKAFAQGLCCPRRCNGARAVEQKILERKGCGDGAREEKKTFRQHLQCLRNDVKGLVEKYMNLDLELDNQAKIQLEYFGFCYASYPQISPLL